MYIFFFSYFARLLYPCLSSQLFLCSKSPACLGFVSLALCLSRYTAPIPTPHPQTPTSSQTDSGLQKTKQAEWFPVCTQLPQGRSQEGSSAVLSCKDWHENKRGKILNVSISPAFCFSFCKYSALFFRGKLLIVSYSSNHHEP